MTRSTPFKAIWRMIASAALLGITITTSAAQSP